MLPGLGAFKNLTEGALKNLHDGVREFSTAALNEVREGVAQVSFPRAGAAAGAAPIPQPSPPPCVHCVQSGRAVMEGAIHVAHNNSQDVAGDGVHIDGCVAGPLPAAGCRKTAPRLLPLL